LAPLRRPTPRVVARPNLDALRPKPDSDYPQPLGEAVQLTTPSGDQTFTAERVLIGRALTCDVVIQDPLVSREHALIRIGCDEVLVEDLGSANGVYVNNARIFEAYQLCDGDRILVGTQELCVFALASQRRRTLPCPAAGSPAVDATAPSPATERLDAAAVLARAAQRMLDLGAPLEAERILADHLRKTLHTARSDRRVTRAVCADAARQALALATALGRGSWFDYAVELHYRAGLPMSIEIAAALAEAAGAVSEVNRMALERYVMWLDANRDPEAEEQASVLRLLESVVWPAT
jgi:predicted component of type VI protein secretion system